ncbi:MAG TPA: phosphate regulon sensor histidine kinase PhoR [Burkholderiales bacterium]|nr:phosphate regulon sensor histidine kinase PhoR [Burkholderiales bacterium]
MNRQSEFVWTRTFAALAVTGVVALALGLAAGWAWGLGIALAGVLVILWRHLSNVSTLLAWLNDTAQPVPDGNGVWEAVFAGLYRLVGGQKKERVQLTEALVRFRSAGTAMPDGVVILDASNHIEWCNPMAERFFDIDSARDVGQAIVNLVRAPGFASYLDEGDFSEPFTLRLTRGEALSLSLRIVPYGQDQKLLLCRDVTQAEKLEIMRRDFVANVSHELKTPLTVVSGFLETLEDGKVNFSERRGQEIIRMMQEQTSRMLRLIDDLLTLSALESSAAPPDEAQFDITPLLAQLAAEGEALSGGRHRIVVHSADPALVMGSERELHSAFGNLVSNAIRYSPQGGSVELAWRVRDSGEGAFTVTDTGIGIDSRHIARLTERFYRVDQSRSRATGGTGLGLAIVKHILTHHQGGLEIRSEPGRGSSFTAVLPARRIAQPEGMRRPVGADQNPAQAMGARVAHS